MNRTTQTNTHMAELFALIQQDHLMTADQLNAEYFSDVVDRTVKAGELDAALGKDTSEPMMSEEEFQEIMSGAVRRPPIVRRVIHRTPRAFTGRTIITEPKDLPSARLENSGVVVHLRVPPLPEFLASTAIRKSEPREQVCDDCKDDQTTEMGLSKPRVIGRVENPVKPINEFHEQVLVAEERPVFGGCIPSVRWGEVDSIITYLKIFREIANPAEDERLGKPAFTKAQIKRRTEDELNSNCFKQMSKKLRRRLLDEQGVLDMDFARKLNDEHFYVSHSVALGKLNVEITPDHKLSWEV